MKSALVLFFLSAVLAVGLTEKSHTMVWGTRESSDILLHRSFEIKKWKALKRVHTDVIFPAKSDPQKYMITQIVAIDQYQNDKGGYAMLTSGGAGYENVGIYIHSLFNRGFSFIIEIYGKRL